MKEEDKLFTTAIDYQKFDGSDSKLTELMIQSELNQKEKENLRIRFQAPLYSPVAVHSRDLFGIEDANRIIDRFLSEVSFDENDDAKRCQ